MIRLRHEEDAGYQEIGATLDMKLEAVRKGLYRALTEAEIQAEMERGRPSLLWSK